MIGRSGRSSSLSNAVSSRSNISRWRSTTTNTARRIIPPPCYMYHDISSCQTGKIMTMTSFRRASATSLLQGVVRHHAVASVGSLSPNVVCDGQNCRTLLTTSSNMSTLAGASSLFDTNDKPEMPTEAIHQKKCFSSEPSAPASPSTSNGNDDNTRTIRKVRQPPSNNKGNNTRMPGGRRPRQHRKHQSQIQDMRNNDHDENGNTRFQSWHGTRTLIQPSRLPYPPNKPLSPYIRQSLSFHPAQHQYASNRKNNVPLDSKNNKKGGDNSFNIIFLGTGAGGQPGHTRTQSSTILRQEGKALIFDTGEATQRQLAFSNVSVLEVRQIFITHMHADHVIGLLSLILQIQAAARASFSSDGRKTLKRGHHQKPFRKQQQQQQQRDEAEDDLKELEPILDIYGPPGLYNYIAMNLKLTCSKLSVPIAVHELVGCRYESGPPSNNEQNTTNPFRAKAYPEMHHRYLLHNTIPQNSSGTWTIQSHAVITEQMVKTAIEARSGQRVLLDNDKDSNENNNTNNSNKQINPHKPSVLPNESHGRKATLQISIEAGEVRHVHGVQTFGYVIQEPEPQIPIDVEKAIALGVRPGPKYRLLKNGFPVESELDNDGDDGKKRMVYPEEVRDESKILKGRKLALLGDNCGLSKSMIDLCQDADILVSEATMKGSDRVAIRRGHSTATMAGNLAKEVNAKVLLLNHISASNDNQSEVNDLVRMAEKKNGDVSQIAASYDFMEFQVPKSGYVFSK